MAEVVAGARTGVAASLAVEVVGGGPGVPVVLGHGLGTDQTMWTDVRERLVRDHVVVTYDQPGSGRSAADAFDPRRHAELDGYAEDLVALLDELALGPVCFVGHSASGMIGVLAHVRRPDLFASLVLIGASPRYLDDEGYVGGFDRAQVEGFLEAMEHNYGAWAAATAPLAMGNPDRPELAEQLLARFQRTEQERAIAFARAIFLSDVRDALPRVSVPTLVLQSADDPMVPDAVAEHLAATIPGAALVRLDAQGHYPHLSGTDETLAHVRGFLTATGGGR